MKKIAISVVVVTIVAVLIFWAVSNSPTKSSGDIRIAGIFALTGKAGTWGVWSKNGIELAIDEINQKGGINGVNVVLISEDTQSDQKLAVAAFEKTVSLQEVSAAIGFVSSGEALACAPVAERTQTVMISPVAGTPDLRTAGDFVFRTRESSEGQTQALAMYVRKKLGISRVAIIYENAANAVGYRDEFRQFFTAAGGEIVQELAYTEGTSDLRPVLTKLQQPIEAVYAPGVGKLIGQLVKQAKELGVKTQWLSSAGVEDPELFTVAGDTADGIIFAAPAFKLDSTNSVMAEFVKQYRAKFGKDPSVYAANAYDAMQVLAMCFKQGSIRGKPLVDALYKIQDFPGASGLVSFDADGEVHKPVVLKTVRAGRFQELNDEGQ